MDTELLVDDQIVEGQLLVERLVQDEFDVSAAFWAKTSEDGLWQLFIASPAVDEKRPSAAYQKVYTLLEAIPSSSISPADIKLSPSAINLLNDKNEIAQAAIELRDRLPARIPTRYHGKHLGNLSVKDVYIYPNIKIPLRQSFLITYVRQGETNNWLATTRRKEFYRGLKSQGIISYSTALWHGDKSEDRKFALIYVLVEVDPELDERAILANSGLLKALADQARMLADEMFKKKYPDALIEHDNLMLLIS
jgi:hypothetical protein